MKNYHSKAFFSLISFLTAFLPLQTLLAYPDEQSLQLAQSPSQEVRSFFETGRLSSDDRLMFRRPPSGVIPPRENSQSWQFIVFKEGNVSFWMPPGVLTDENLTLVTPVGDIVFRTLASRTDDRSFMAAYAPSLTEEQIQQPRAILKAIQEKAAPEPQFKLVNTRNIKIDEFPGIELVFEGEEDAIIVRAYLVNQKAYVLGVRYPKSDPQERQTRAFLNALQLLPSS